MWLLVQARRISHHCQSKDSWRRSLELPGPLGTQAVQGRGGIPGLLQKGECTRMGCRPFTCTELARPQSCHAYHNVLVIYFHVHTPITAIFGFFGCFSQNTWCLVQYHVWTAAWLQSSAFLVKALCMLCWFALVLELCPFGPPLLPLLPYAFPLHSCWLRIGFLGLPHMSPIVSLSSQRGFPLAWYWLAYRLSTGFVLTSVSGGLCRCLRMCLSSPAMLGKPQMSSTSSTKGTCPSTMKMKSS